MYVGSKHALSLEFVYYLLVENETKRLVNNALAQGTHTSYARSVQRFQAFAHRSGVNKKCIFTAKTVELWIADLSLSKCSHGSVLSHISALRHYYKVNGIDSSLDSPKMKLMLRGLKRTAVPSLKPCYAMSCSELERFCQLCTKVVKDSKRLIAMVTLAFYGFLRPSEYCVSSAGHSLKWGDICIGKKKNAVQLKFQTYKHSKGSAIITVWAVHEPITCPVSALIKYRKFVGSKGKDEPLFQTSINSFREEFSHLCKLAKLREGLTPHSLRRGGVTWASRIGWSDTRIKVHGRWQSDAYKQYARSH